MELKKSRTKWKKARQKMGIGKKIKAQYEFGPKIIDIRFVS